MPHAQFVEHSTHMSKDVGDAFAHLYLLKGSGVKGPGAVALRNLEAALNRVSDRNAAIGKDAHGLSDEVPEAENPKPALSEPVVVEQQPRVEANIVKDPAKR